jgi:YD repeat-containing protein
MTAAALILPQFRMPSAAMARGFSLPTTIRQPMVAAPAGRTPPQRIAIPEPPRRTPPPFSLPNHGGLHAAAVSVRAPRGARVAGPPMLRPSEIDGVLAAARARARQAGTRRIDAVQQPAPSAPAPGHLRGAAAPSPIAARRTRTLQSPSGTGINPWWRYQEENVPGGGHVMVNVGTGNMLLQDDDMAVRHKGISLTFRRTYNSQSQHDTTGTDGAVPSMYGNGWTNTFDAHLSGSRTGTISVWDVDGARYDYTVAADGVTMVPPPGQHATLVSDGYTGYFWTKKSGTTYYFWAPDGATTWPTSVYQQYGAYAGRLYQIIGRNRSTHLIFYYTWDNSNSAAGGKIHAIAAQAESGLTATLSFTDVGGRRVLTSMTYPDGATAVSYMYDQFGNLVTVKRPPNNNVAGATLSHSYGWQTLGTYTVMAWADSPRWESCDLGCGTDGAWLQFGFTGTTASLSLSAISHGGVINPTIADGSSSPTLQSGYPTTAIWYLGEYFTSGTTPTFRDSDNHATNWVMDSQARPIQTQECTVVANQTCTGAYLITNESWDADNNLISDVDPRGAETDYAYDIDGNTVAAAAPAPAPGAFRPTSLYTYGPYDNLAAFCDPIATHALQADWTSPPAGPVPVGSGACSTQNVSATRYQWLSTSNEPYGQLASAVSPATPAAPSGYQRTYTYDPAQQGGADYGLPTAVTGAAITQNDPTTPMRQPQQTFWYDANGNLVCYGNGNGQWLLGYDALGRATSAADPDDSSSGTGVCGKSGGQPNWNTTTRTAYFPDGSISSRQTASQVANGIGTTFTYDLDGNVTSETHHYGCLTTASCTTGVTKKVYDGADRLVEVQAPYDVNDVQAYPWSTRYLYDLSQGGGAAYRGLRLSGHGNLVVTQELLSGTVWGPAYSQRYGIATGSWTDVRATSSDALDRPVSNYEAALGDQPKLTNTYDAAGSAGLLSSVDLATNERKVFAYDGAGRETDITYPRDPAGAVTPAIHQIYDADGRVTSRSTSVLGTETIAYDPTGAVTSVSEPVSVGGGTIRYQYYADGLRSQAGYSDANVIAPNALQYAYRSDGKRDRLTLSNGTAFSWTYTAAGRMLSQSDPLTGSTVYPTATYSTAKASKPFYPSSITYAPWTAAYDGYGRVNTLTLPVSLFSYTGSQYDLEDGIAQHTKSGYDPRTSSHTSTALACLESTIRNEKTALSKGYLTGSCAMSPDPPQTINGAQVVARASSVGANAGSSWAPGGVQDWTLDARSGMLLHVTAPLGSDTVGASYTYDASGRLTQDFEADADNVTTTAGVAGATGQWCPVIYFGQPGYSSMACYSNGTRTKTYDAENRLRSETFTYTPEVSSGGGPAYTPTSYGFAMYGAVWQDTSGYGQPRDLQTVDYGATSHPTRFALYHQNLAALGLQASESRVWLWDGNDRFVECSMSNGTCQSPTLSLEGLGDYDLVHGTMVQVYDRNRSGNVVLSRNATSFSSWSDTASWGDRYGASGPCSIDVVDNSINPTICDPRRDGKFSPDGWSLDYETWQGVRTFDPAVGQWNSPDAYAGDVHDPMSQKPFMWNRNNPYEYSDPTGYCAGPLIIVCYEILTVGAALVGEAAAPGLGGGGGAAASAETKALPAIGEDLYRSFGRSVFRQSRSAVMPGGTAGAIRHELAGGAPVGGKSHLRKGAELIRGLTRWIAENPNATKHDIDTAKKWLQDLKDAFGSHNPDDFLRGVPAPAPAPAPMPQRL